MSISARKEREFKERENLILRTSFDMLLTEGYMGFTIDKLAKKIDYAKGTVYKHFACKEDIVMKILNEAFKQRIKVLERIKTLDIPERALVMAGTYGMSLYNKLNPNLHRLLQIGNVESIWNKVSQDLKDEHNSMVTRIFDDFELLVQRAVKNKNLELGEHESIDIYFSIICLSMGFSGMLRNTRDAQIPHNVIECLCNSRLVKDPARVLRLAMNTFLDGLNWRPLTGNYDYNALETEVTDTVFSDLKKIVEGETRIEFILDLDI